LFRAFGWTRKLAGQRLNTAYHIRERNCTVEESKTCGLTEEVGADKDSGRSRIPGSKHVAWTKTCFSAEKEEAGLAVDRDGVTNDAW
jgi:hypothetical protein